MWLGAASDIIAITAGYVLTLFYNVAAAVIRKRYIPCVSL